MKLTLTLTTAAGTAQDVVVSCDATATIADVARALAGDVVETPVTLWLTDLARGRRRMLNPLLSVHESGIRSGERIEVAAAVRESTLPAQARATVEVLTGSGAGSIHHLPDGVSFVGRDPSAHVRLRDRLVSRRHARIDVADTIVVTDLNSANGVAVDGVMVDRAVVTGRHRVRVGETELRVTIVPGAATARSRPHRFRRSPRVASSWAAEEVEVPTLPVRGSKPRLAWLGVAVPVAAGAVLFAVTRNPIMLLFVALSPVLMIGMWLDQTVRFRRQRREEEQRFTDGLAALAAELSASNDAEKAARRAESPSAGVVAEAIRARSSLLWTRMPEHAAFLTVRLGTASLPSRRRVPPVPRRLDARDDEDRISSVVEAHGLLDEAPVVERLADAGALGIAGPGSLARSAARSVLLQIAGLHSPGDVAISAFATGASVAEWEWLKWLPHVDSPHSPLRAPLAADERRAARLIAELEDLVRDRRGDVLDGAVRSHEAAGAAGAPDLWHPVRRVPVLPVVVVLIVDAPSTDRARLVALANEGPDVGVHTIWLADAVDRLPVVCRTSLEVDVASAKARFVRHGATVALTGVDLVTEGEARMLARDLAPLEDDGAPVVDESDLPRHVALVELFDDDIAGDAEAVVNRWKKNDSIVSGWRPGVRREPAGLGAVVGQGVDAPFRIDLRRDGPHALVGGTTGSGKSEFLQTWLLGLSVEHAPDRLTLLLVDYKGGAAFGDCALLPHTVGLVTDLTPHLVTRALTSLRAEITRRERLLAAKGAKDLVALEETGDPEAPPALVIVIDEFAALVSEVPEFVDGVIDIAQRGRSLGLHLVMATQRPAGVIRESLRANTNLRIALRVADEADSLDVLGVDRAAHFDAATPGRAAAKRGAGRVVDFQGAYVGGSGERSTAAVVEVRDLPFAAGQVWPSPDAPRRDEEKDIERLVRVVGDAAASCGIRPPRRPWLDALPATVDLSSLRTEPGAVVIGMRDQPARQRHVPFSIDLEQIGGVAVFGASGSGKTTVLRTLAMSAARGERTWVYAIDMAGGGLTRLRDLPHVGAVIDGSDVERIRRLLDRLVADAAHRAALFAGAHASTLSEFNAQSAALPRIIVLLDGMSAFRVEYEFHDGGRMFDALVQLMAIGRQLGIHVVLTADRQSALPQSLLATVRGRLVLRMAADTEYDILGAPRDALADAPPGRGFWEGDEVQVAVPGGTADLAAQAAALTVIGEGVTDAAPDVERLEEEIPWSGLAPTVDGDPTLGVADDTLGEVGMPEGLFVVTGPYRSGRTTAVRTAIMAIRRAWPAASAYLISARPGPLDAEVEWTVVANDTETASALAAELAKGPPSGCLIVIEGIAELEGPEVETALVALLRVCRRTPGVRVVIEADTLTTGGSWQLGAQLKTARAGIVLQPEQSDGTGIFRVHFPNVTRAGFPPGRGFFVDSGRIRTVQVALPR